MAQEFRTTKTRRHKQENDECRTMNDELKTSNSLFRIQHSAFHFLGVLVPWWWILSFSLLLLSGPVAIGFAVSSDEVHVSSNQHESQTTSQTSDPSDPQSAIRNPQSAIQLVLGVPIERALAGGEVHAYQIALVSG